jgi:hypothetical protein
LDRLSTEEIDAEIDAAEHGVRAAQRTDEGLGWKRGSLTNCPVRSTEEPFDLPIGGKIVGFVHVSIPIIP